MASGVMVGFPAVTMQQSTLKSNINTESDLYDYSATLLAMQTNSPADDAPDDAPQAQSRTQSQLQSDARRPGWLFSLAWRVLFTVLALLALTLLGLLTGSTLLESATAGKPMGRVVAAPAQAPNAAPLAFGAGDRLVMAFYYSWFDENTWTYDKLSDLPSETYVSRDRAVMGRHIDQAKAAGIDALILAWYGPAGGSNQTEPNLAAMLDEAAARDFKIGILFETNSPFFGGTGDVTAALQHAQNTHFNHPAYLRVDGRPVVYFWKPTLYGVDAWRNIRSQVDPGYGSIWISEGVDTSYLDVFDGHHLYSNTWNPPADLHSVNQRYANDVAAARDRLGAYKFWVATAMPGYNDVKIRPGSGFAQDRQGGAYYTRSWDAAIASNPNWIVVNSFNEWPEGSYIEPSATYGDQFLGLTAQYGGQFKAGGNLQVALAAPAPVESAAVESAPAEPAPTPTPTPEPDSPTAFVEVALLNMRAGPGTDFPIVDQLAQGTALPITGQHPAAEQWWQVQNDTQTGWVHRDFVVDGGPLAQVTTLADAALPALAAEPATQSDAATAPDTATDEPAEVQAASFAEIAESAQAEVAESELAEREVAAAEVADTDPAAVALAAREPAASELAASELNADESTISELAASAANAENNTLAAAAELAGLAWPLADPEQVSLHPYLSR